MNIDGFRRVRVSRSAAGAADLLSHSNAIRPEDHLAPERIRNTLLLSDVSSESSRRDPNSRLSRETANSILNSSVDSPNACSFPDKGAQMGVPPFQVSATALVALCNSLQIRCFSSPVPVVEVLAPVKVFGDIHGQVHDLMEIFRQHGRPSKYRGDILAINYVFNGDFVDRGENSLEVVCILFSLKFLYGTRITLIRGNHEIRSLNKDFGLLDECLSRYGAERGKEVYEAINTVFDHLPLATVLQGLSRSVNPASGEESWSPVDRIMVVHGGIGSGFRNIQQLRSLRLPLQEINDPVFVHALWNDPSVDTKNGFSVNPERGAGVEFYGELEVNRFCQESGIDAIIRSHECVANGYEFFAGGILMTVFSARDYSNYMSNHAAIVLVTNDSRSYEQGCLLVTPLVVMSNSRNSITPSTIYARSTSPTRDEKRRTQKILDSDYDTLQRFIVPFQEEIMMNSDARQSIMDTYSYYCHVYGNLECKQMTFPVFKAFLENENCKDFILHRAQDFFRAFDMGNNGIIDFNVFTLGVTAMRPDVPHVVSSASGQVRILFIFRMYNRSRSKYLNHQELENLIQDICELIGMTNVQEIQYQVSQLLNALLPPTKQTGVSLHEFYEAVRTSTIRGTSRLFRFDTKE